MPKCRMLINYVPGDECRIAIVEEGKLEEYHAERFDSLNRVGNIYLGRVANVEPGIQAAFVDFGVEENGFLHVSDLHPMYFPGEDDETTERVGRKTPRRERPPIQRALKRGQEILVQVLKDGVGTKGPALTSYLSIPGRFLVMMPQMDRVGVSRKVEDEDRRRKMRQILDQLDLPDGFGFILRTAGFDRTKTELKRDLAYLSRLWKDMERKQKGGKAPRLLYTESDLLVRALRDQLTSEIDEVVIDSEVALKRASRFMRIVAPRSRTKLMRHTGSGPLFHAFGVEEQIAAMHAREVGLKSGGRLVIDETEALIAIDVNSGKTRGTRDPETTAYKTNLEATDEICRQLRLRDQGGLVICDLIDMRDAKHRKEIENRFRDRLKRDRARSTILPISGFGILEMTRQRIKGSHESVHFSECPTCTGRGLVQRAESVASDALREMSALISRDKVARVEMVVSPRVAGALLSTKRAILGRIERASGKRVEVRVSDSVPLDRVRLYAYEENGNDIDIDKLPQLPAPEVEAWDGDAVEDWAADATDEAERLAEEDAQIDAEPEEPDDDEMLDEAEDEEKPKKKRRRRRGGRGRKKKTAQTDEEVEDEEKPEDESPGDEPKSTGSRKKKTRKKTSRKKTTTKRDEEQPDDAAESSGDEDNAQEDESDDKPKKKRRRRRGGRGRKKASGDESQDESAETEASKDDPEPVDTDADAPKKKRRRRGGRGRKKSADSETANGSGEVAEMKPEPVVKPRGIYAAGRRRLSSSEKSRMNTDRD